MTKPNRRTGKLLVLVLVLGLWLKRGAGGAKGKAGAKPKPPKAYRNTPFWRVYDGAAGVIDRWVGWDKLPKWPGLLVLIGLRNTLRKKNLYDTRGEAAVGGVVPAPFDAEFLTVRTADGTYNDLSAPAMGAAGTRFGRNVPIDKTWQEPMPGIMEPNPRVVSLELMTRHEFVPATTLNVLAACWIQFMVKDWFTHGEGDPDNHWSVPLPDGDAWFQEPMRILKTPPDANAAGSDRPNTFVNRETHWWDGSQIYGTSIVDQKARRTGEGGRLILGQDGRLIVPEDPRFNFTLVPGWWLGLDMLAVLFVKEHNAVCERLAEEYPSWSDEELFHRARLIVSALMAKFHTVEWTPAIIAHPTTVAALRANWWGVAGEKIRRTFGRVSESEVVSGIPGSDTDHYGVPYSLTEEFTVVYRMHPLTRDEYEFHSVADGSQIDRRSLRDLAGPNTAQVTKELSYEDVFYSFGVTHPGALVLNNFPRFLQEFQRPDKPDILMDLAATDVMRARELGVPRYNEFRRLLHLRPMGSFEELCQDDGLARRMSDVYGGDIERVDLMVGMFAEKPPKGFGFSDTAFRIFIVMASRRLNSDRFLTNDFTPEVYSPVGYDWVQNTTMTDVLLRHFPALRPALRGVENPFAPWARVGA